MAQAQLAHTAVVSGFVDSLQEPWTPYICPKRLSKALGVNVAKSTMLRSDCARHRPCRLAT